MTIVTIDGPAGSGKSTVAKAVSRRTGIPYLSTGLLYRAVALAAARAGVSPEAGEPLDRFLKALRLQLRPDERGGFAVFLDDAVVPESDLKADAIGGGASQFSALPAVRARLLDIQRDAAGPAGIIVDGRDTGSVIFPAADVKVFLRADPHERARRRARELGLPEDDPATLNDMLARDARDSGRDAAPLVVPSGATEIDCTALTVEQVVDRLLQLMA